MFRSYLTIALRNLLKYKGHSIITVSGLSVGIACCILILLYITYELGYDRYHGQAERIHRVEVAGWATTSVGVAPYIKKEFPDVENVVRFFRVNRAIVGTQHQMFTEKRFYFADSSVFRIFSFGLLSGNPDRALASPNSIVLTRDMAAKYFGTENPIGKSLTVRLSRQEVFQVTGVVENVPPQSHFQFDFLASFNSLPFKEEDNRTQWTTSLVYSYALMRPGADLHKIEQRLTRVLHERTNTPDSLDFEAHLRPIADIHLYSECEKEVEPVSSMTNIYILATIAILILLLAAVNFVNLTTARSMKRAREVALRKTVGAHRGQLIGQFLGESFLSSLLATVIAIGIVEILLPSFNDLTGVRVSLLTGGSFTPFIVLIVPGVLVGLAAGSYPAFYLSRFQPARILKSGAVAETPSSGTAVIRNALVVLQFSVSVSLIVGSFIIGKQLQFIQEKKLGLDTEQVIVIPISSISGDRYSSLKSELVRRNLATAVTGSFSVPGERVVYEAFEPKDAPEKTYYVRLLLTDFDFAETYGFVIKEGRSFSHAFTGDTSGAFLVNEKAAALFQWNNPTSKRITFTSQNRSGDVVGVVRDFNFASLHSEVEPLVVHLSTNTAFYKYVSVKLPKGNKREAVSNIENLWKTIFPDTPFEYYFLDESFRKLYITELKLQAIVTSFTGVGIVIACLGLLGLVSHAVVRRTKEIGVRKVLGASVTGIVGLVTREFLKLVLLANVIAFPVAYFLMKKWLEAFAFRIDIEVVVFIVAGVATLAIAFLTICVQAIRAAQANPVESLRYE